MSTAHPTTPGPWVIVEETECPFHVFIDGADGSQVAWFRRPAYSTAHKSVADVMAGKDLGDAKEVAAAVNANAKQAANIRAIAATPELIRALKLCAAVCAGETVHKSGLVEALEAARAVLAKVQP